MQLDKIEFSHGKHDDAMVIVAPILGLTIRHLFHYAVKDVLFDTGVLNFFPLNTNKPERGRCDTA